MCAGPNGVRNSHLQLYGSEGFAVVRNIDVGIKRLRTAFVQELRDKYLGSVVESNGRIIVDEQGSMLLAESSQLVDIDSVLAAQELRSSLEVMSS